MSRLFFENASSWDAFDGYLNRLAGSWPGYEIGFTEGRNYVRVWKRLPKSDGKSVVAFVDRAANLYQADSWKKRGRLLRRL